MSQSSPGDVELVSRLQQRISLLERLLATHRIPVPEDAAASSTLGFPELDFSEPIRKDAVSLPVRAALEEFDHITRSITALWGQDGFDEYLSRLIVDERGTRKGFSMDAMEELLLLARLARARKALYGMGFDRPARDGWKDLPEAERRSARVPTR
jgi:hypothetical protein